MTTKTPEDEFVEMAMSSADKTTEGVFIDHVSGLLLSSQSCRKIDLIIGTEVEGDFDKAQEDYDIKVHTTFDCEGNPIYYVRAEPIRKGELLYDSKGKLVAIETKGQLLAIIKGEE